MNVAAAGSQSLSSCLQWLRCGALRSLATKHPIAPLPPPPPPPPLATTMKSAAVLMTSHPTIDHVAPLKVDQSRAVWPSC
jgi:hypothetical protein